MIETDEEYYKKPNICKQCNQILKIKSTVWHTRKKKFCNLSCGAKYNGKKNRIRKKEEYYKNPNICLYCNQIISIKITIAHTRKKKFCNHSCFAKYNNKKRIRIRKNRKDCPNCGKQVPSHTSAYCSKKCWIDYTYKITINKIEKQGYINAKNSIVAKKYLIYKFSNKCSICDLVEWQNKSIVLVLDHIDGNSQNNYLENLRLVCPNCDSQLPTFKGRNKGNGRYSRKQRYKEGKSY